MKSRKALTLFIAFSLAAACAVEKSENPLSPSIAGPIAGVEISAPKPLEPSSGAQIPATNQPVTLLLENSYSTGPRPLNYTFEVATDADFTNRVYTREGVSPGENGRTSLRLPDALGGGRAYYWRAKAQDGANAGPYSSPTAFNVFTPVGFEKPSPIAPVNNDRVDSLVPTFRFGNAPHVGQPQGVGYVIEVATNDSFANKLAAWQVIEGPNETSFPAAANLPPGSQLFWHVRAFDGGTLGPWSDTQVFRTPTPVAPAPPPGDGGASGGPCHTQTSHLAVIQCQRKNFAGRMSRDQLNQFLRAVARDMNRANLPDGPYGILPKENGNQCNGYSCDIICSSRGIWDALMDSDDAQEPVWSYKGPNNVATCLIIR